MQGLARRRGDRARGSRRPARVYRIAFSRRLWQHLLEAVRSRRRRRPASPATSDVTARAPGRPAAGASRARSRRRSVPRSRLAKESVTRPLSPRVRKSRFCESRVEVPHLEERVADRLAVLLGRALLLERHLERAAQHRQRRAQLVRDVGDELLLLLLGARPARPAARSGSRRLRARLRERSSAGIALQRMRSRSPSSRCLRSSRARRRRASSAAPGARRRLEQARAAPASSAAAPGSRTR